MLVPLSLEHPRNDEPRDHEKDVNPDEPARYEWRGVKQNHHANGHRT